MHTGSSTVTAAAESKLDLELESTVTRFHKLRLSLFKLSLSLLEA